MEDLGFFSKGTAAKNIASGITRLGGKGIIVNTSGGLKAAGHPVGATGVAQIYEVWLQLRGEAGERQVPGAKAALTQNGGGMVRGEAAATVVHILSV